MVGAGVFSAEFTKRTEKSVMPKAVDWIKKAASGFAPEDNKVLLKQKYDEAKAAAELVNRARGETTRLKAEIERRRVEAAMAALVADGKVGGGAGVPEVYRIPSSSSQ